ncbi:glycosyltransferase [Sinomonas humi]|uniref:glycosyltransferase n=1 Tax=Sinomonas humi TaxID=1338436 RepID=UPI0006903113|nr:glycosyltransferase [Sinomonas humi]
MPSSAIDHVVLTRFNLPSPGLEQSIRNRDGWLESRVDLFEKFCLPSVAAQEEKDFSWIVYFDPESPEWLKQRIALWRAAGILRPCFRASVSPEELIGDLSEVSRARQQGLVTTNLDNDDALASDFTGRVKRLAERSTGATALYLVHGLIARGGRLYRRTDSANAFCSVVSPWSDPQTCWADWHNLLGTKMPVLIEEGPPAWLQVVHGRNVSNRVHGALTSPALYTRRFPGLLDAMPEPKAMSRARDALLDQPGRVAREATRALVKRAIVAAAGRGALDRVRLGMRKGTGLGSLSGRSRRL